MNTMAAEWDRNTALSLGVVLAGLLLLYFPYLKTLLVDWETNDNYSHGYFIPLLSLYMVYSIRDRLRDLPVQPGYWGLVLILMGLGQLVIAKIGAEFFLQRTSFIVVLLGVILFFLGTKYFKALLVPVLYLVFMIPLPAVIWNKIAFPLQLFSSFLTEKVVSLLGISVFREGNILHLAETSLEVVDACSGLRSLVTMFALSAAFAWMQSLPVWKKWLLFFMAAPIAIFANIIRLTGTAILASRYGGDVAQGFLHEFSGMVTFFVGLGLLIGLSVLLGRPSRDPSVTIGTR